MTAMMAFFLVMWLINATDKKVLTQVATYFNPLRLTDKAPTPRGLHDSDTGAPGSENAPGQSKAKDGKAKGAKLSPAQQKFVEDALFNDPYGTLEVLAQQAASGSREQPRTNAAGRTLASAQLPGEAFRDPFDPNVRPSTARESAEAAGATVADAGMPGAAEGAARAMPDTVVGDEPERLDKATDKAKDGSADKDKVGTADRDKDKAGAGSQVVAGNGLADAVQGAAAEAKERIARQSAEQAETAKLDAEIKQALASLGPGMGPGLEVNVTEDGLLISLTDKFDFGMFGIASAEPRPTMVAVMERIAKVLQTRPGQLIVRGHTDGRPFRSATYDNWRLSTARAHMAYYMLVRGGLDEKRFERVEGYADRSLRVPSDPEAAQNRRIELLLRKPTP